MSPQNERSRPAGNGPAKESLNHDALEYGRRPLVLPPPCAWTPFRGWRARRDAALRMPPIESGARDPLDTHGALVPSGRPSDFGLSADALHAEANRLFAEGWSVEEIVERLSVELPERIQ